jgi:hypothetical protein
MARTIGPPPRRRTAILLVALVTLAMAGAVFAASSATAQAWFDRPLAGTRLSLGPIDITAHATSPGGVEEVTFAVDGTQVGSASFASSRLVTATFTWQPDREKGYLLTVRGRSGQEWGTPSSVFVIVGPASQSPAPTTGAGGASACQPANVVFGQDFSSGAGTFETYDFDVVAGMVRDGAYHLTFTGSGDISMAPARQRFGDACVAVDVVDVGPNASGRYGVFCRLPEEGTYYEFFIDSTGRAGTRVGSYLGGGSSQQPVYRETDAVRTGLGAVNRVRGECIGSTFTMWVNDQLVGSFQEPTQAAGDVGFFATSATDGGTDVAFDNFAVTAP